MPGEGAAAVSALGDLLDGIAADLNTAGLGVYDPARVWTAADTATAVRIGPMPAAPDRVIVLGGYRLGGDSPDVPSGQINVQFRTRCPSLDPRLLETLDGGIYDLLQGMTGRPYGSIVVTQALHKSSLDIGQDSNNRLMRSMNVAFDLDLTATANRSY